MSKKFKYQNFLFVKFPDSVVMKFKTQRAARNMFNQIELQGGAKRGRHIYRCKMSIEYIPAYNEIWMKTDRDCMSFDYLRFIYMCQLQFIDD